MNYEFFKDNPAGDEEECYPEECVCDSVVSWYGFDDCGLCVEGVDDAVSEVYLLQETVFTAVHLQGERVCACGGAEGSGMLFCLHLYALALPCLQAS